MTREEYMRQAADESRARQNWARLFNLSNYSNAGQLFTDLDRGFTENAAMLASGTLAMPIAGLAGLAATPFDALAGGDGFAADTVRNVQDALTYAPRSNAGRQGAGNIAAPVEAVDTLYRENVSNPIGDAFGPVAGAAAYTLPAAIGAALPMVPKGYRARVGQRFRDGVGGGGPTPGSPRAQIGAVGDIKGHEFRRNPEVDSSGDVIVKPGREFSTRNPTAEGMKDAHHQELLTIDPVEWMGSAQGKAAWEALRQNPHFKTGGARSAQAGLQNIGDQWADNVRFVYDKTDATERATGGVWYPGFNGLAQIEAARVGKPIESGSAAIAAQSPQTPWGLNVEQAQRASWTLENMNDFRFSPDMQAISAPNSHQFATRFHRSPELHNMWQNIQGKTLMEVRAGGSPMEVAMWLQAFDKGHMPAGYVDRTPTGMMTDEVLTKSGKLAGYSPNTLANASAAVQAYLGREVAPAHLRGRNHDVDFQMASAALGEANKVRNFGSDGSSPNRTSGLTGDTHAVAVNVLQPLGADDAYVLQNFGGSFKKTDPAYEPWMTSRGMNTNTSGAKGTYPLHQYAMQQPAREYVARGEIPRENAMQSITWEKGRTVMDGKKSAANKAAADQIWREYKRGRRSQSSAQEAVWDLFQ